MDNAIIAAMKEIIALWESEENCREEISMWRERYLSSLPKYENPNYAAQIWASFLYTPSMKFSKTSPEELIKLLEGSFHENK